MSGAIAYLGYRDEKDVLCVIDGENFHVFEVAPHVIARLVAEGGLRMWREFGIGGGTPGWAAKLGIEATTTEKVNGRR